MYVGLAIRTALAMGINRESGPNSKKPPSLLRAESRTWWYVNHIAQTMGNNIQILTPELQGSLLARDVCSIVGILLFF
jgi:hypothetical protein